MNIWKYLREKQIGKYFSAYLLFIVLNYVLCLAPIGASYYFSTQTMLLSSFLAYCFTLLAVTVYSFIFFPKESVGGTIVANLAIGITILFMVFYIVSFILYNLVDSIANVLNTSIMKTASLAFIPAFVISLGHEGEDRIPLLTDRVVKEGTGRTAVCGPGTGPSRG